MVAVTGAYAYPGIVDHIRRQAVQTCGWVAIRRTLPHRPGQICAALSTQRTQRF